MLSTVPGAAAIVPVGNASPLAAPLEKLIDTDGVAEEDEFRAAVELWVPVCEYVEVGVLDGEREDHVDIDIEGVEIDDGGGGT